MMTPDTPVDAIRPAEWRANYTLKPDMRLLADSLRDYGWLSPILVRREDATIVDGFHRWVAAQNDQEIMRRDRNMVPVAWLDIDQVDAMIMHVRLNRARGELQARALSNILHQIHNSRKYRHIPLHALFQMRQEEVELLFDASLLKSRKISEHRYSAAWIPIEAPRPSANIVDGVSVERPPNPDR